VVFRDIINFINGEMPLSALFGRAGVALLVSLLALIWLVIVLTPEPDKKPPEKSELLKRGRRKNERLIVYSAMYVILVFPICVGLGISNGLTGPAIVALAAVIAIFPLACFAAYRIWSIHRRRYVVPVREMIMEITYGGPVVSPPKPALIIYREMKATEKKILLIRKRLASKGGYSSRFFNFYDSYCALYLEMRFQLYMALMRGVLAGEGGTGDIGIHHFIYVVKGDVEQMKRLLLLRATDNNANHMFDMLTEEMNLKSLRETDLSPFEEHYDKVGGKMKKYSSDAFIKTNEAMKAIRAKISAAEACLLSVQSNGAGGDMSVHAQENDFHAVIEQLRQLDKESCGFIAEYERNREKNEM
jgi:hypothetical protein